MSTRKSLLGLKIIYHMLAALKVLQILLTAPPLLVVLLGKPVVIVTISDEKIEKNIFSPLVYVQGVTQDTSAK